jgi:hypothetical protein
METSIVKREREGIQKIMELSISTSFNLVKWDNSLESPWIG